MTSGPRTGDAFGELMRAGLAENRGHRRPSLADEIAWPLMEVIERDDGYVQSAPAAFYFAKPAQWLDIDRRAVELASGRTLDIGTGAGRVALELQDRGVPVTGLDVSPGAVDVARVRGVRRVLLATVDELARTDDHVGSFDTFLMMGNNAGLLEGPRRAAEFLAALARLAAPGARIIAQGTDPYAAVDPVHVAYRLRNQEHGRAAGLMVSRVRFLDIATDWFRYLLCSPEELSGLVDGTGWRIAHFDDADLPLYLAVLTRDAVPPPG